MKRRSSARDPATDCGPEGHEKAETASVLMAAFSANGKPSARGKSPHHTPEREGGKAGSRSRMKSPLPLSLGRAFSNSPRGEVVHHAHRAEFWTVNNFLGERNGALI